MSYASCAGFVRDLDRIYVGLGVPEDNPMRLNPNTGLWDDDTFNVFENARFPKSYSFTQDEQGVNYWGGHIFAEQVKRECVIILSACLALLLLSLKKNIHLPFAIS